VSEDQTQGDDDTGHFDDGAGEVEKADRLAQPGGRTERQADRAGLQPHEQDTQVRSHGQAEQRPRGPDQQ
jgi:hypothetical protein